MHVHLPTATILPRSSTLNMTAQNRKLETPPTPSWHWHRWMAMCANPNPNCHNQEPWHIWSFYSHAWQESRARIPREQAIGAISCSWSPSIKSSWFFVLWTFYAFSFAPIFFLASHLTFSTLLSWLSIHRCTTVTIADFAELHWNHSSFTELTALSNFSQKSKKSAVIELSTSCRDLLYSS